MSYFVTSIAYYPNPSEQGMYTPRSHTFGHFFDILEAKAAVTKNVGNMCECLYNFLVIEEIGFGVHALAKNEWWYQFSNKKNGWVKTKKPIWSNHVVNWALG